MRIVPRLHAIALLLLSAGFGQIAPGIAYAASGKYYVARGGSDASPGSADLPWRTIGKAAKSARPGATVLIEGGVYYERVSIQVSGNPTDGPITFMPVPGQTVILRSPGSFVSTDGFPTGLIDIRDRAWITISGLEITDFTGDSNSTFPAGIAVVGSGDHITITHNHVHDIYGSRNGRFDAHGIAVYGTSAAGITNVTIDGNEVDHLRLGQSEALVVNGNVSSWQVTNNIVHDNDNIGIVAIGFEGKSPVAALDQARDGLIAGNLVYNIDSDRNPTYGPHSEAADGIYVDGGTRIVIERNRVHHTNIGIEMASEHRGKTTSDVIARNNLVYLNYGPGVSLGGYDAIRGSSQRVAVINNIFYSNDSRHLGAGEIQLQYWPRSAPADNRIVNNIVSPNSQALVLTTVTRVNPVMLDYNLYDTRYRSLIWTWNTTDSTGLPGFQAASGQEDNGLAADPLFTSRILPDLRPVQTSPARGAGVDLGAALVGTVDFAGAPRVSGTRIDIGAFELP